MNKSELIEAIANYSKLNINEAGPALDGLIKTIEGALSIV